MDHSGHAGGSSHAALRYSLAGLDCPECQQAAAKDVAACAELETALELGGNYRAPFDGAVTEPRRKDGSLKLAAGRLQTKVVIETPKATYRIRVSSLRHGGSTYVAPGATVERGATNVPSYRAATSGHGIRSTSLLSVSTVSNGECECPAGRIRRRGHRRDCQYAAINQAPIYGGGASPDGKRYQCCPTCDRYVPSLADHDCAGYHAAIADNEPTPTARRKNARARRAVVGTREWLSDSDHYTVGQDATTATWYVQRADVELSAPIRTGAVTGATVRQVRQTTKTSEVRLLTA